MSLPRSSQFPILTLYTAFLCALALLTSCIADEPLNAECDITGVESSWLEEQGEQLVGNPLIGNNRIVFSVKAGTDLTAQAPRFTLTEGATLSALVNGETVDANGITRNFTKPQTYTTHSQDGKWAKEYSVAFTPLTFFNEFHFENYELDGSGRYEVWYEKDTLDANNSKRYYWATGNGGYAILGMAKTPDAFPTVATEGSISRKAVKLTTLNTGSYGKLVGMPIAAGSIFLGSFDVRNAMSKPRLATHFGLQLINKHPLRLEGYYKYTAGETFTDKDKNVCPERHDTADIYAVVYEAKGHYYAFKGTTPVDSVADFAPLQGDNVLTDDRIVMMARIENPGEPQDWIHFSEPFKLLPGKSLDETLLNTNGYAIAVVATSSRQGAYFEGAIGSTLWIDELKIVWQDETEE